MPVEGCRSWCLPPGVRPSVGFLAHRPRRSVTRVGIDHVDDFVDDVVQRCVETLQQFCRVGIALAQLLAHVGEISDESVLVHRSGGDEFRPLLAPDFRRPGNG